MRWQVLTANVTANEGPTTRTVALPASVQTETNDFAASNLMRPAYSAGIIVWLVAAASNVKPSRLAAATASVASTALAPGVFSTMKVCDNDFAVLSANTLGTRSDPSRPGRWLPRRRGGGISWVVCCTGHGAHWSTAARWIGNPGCSKLALNTEPLTDSVQYSVLRSTPPKATFVSEAPAQLRRTTSGSPR